ncbi:hypothetical protein GJAV_G00210860 [Gymnothorax javanicus]|nr:hypothetical protein GJAV_G00210860 [Gymnothorax javanicus]
MHTSVERRSDPSFANGDHKTAQRSLSSRVDIVRSLEPGVVREGWRLLNVFLTGGAPWGFTLKGGLEYHEPLIITKVEEGGQAWAVRLQVGDEVVTVNEFPLSGYRQEAIGLIKGSYKTLALGVRRKTETATRPHSWHATKFAEAQQYALQRQAEDAAISHYASFSTEDLSRNWDQTNLQRVSHQFSSVGSMDSLEHCLEPYNPGGLSRAERSGSSEYLGGAKRDSAYSSFSTGCGTPDHTLFRSNTASSENMASKAGGWDSHNWSSVDEKQGTRQGGGRDSPRHSGSATGGRSNIGPVWHVPEKKQTATPCPPLPPVPLRSDSFGAMVHGQTGLISYGEGPNSSAEQRTTRQSRGGDGPLDSVSRGHQADDGGSSVRWSYNLTSKNEVGFPPHSQLNVRSSMGLPGHSHEQGHIDDSHPSHRASVPATLGLRDAGGCHGNIQEYRKGVGWGGAVDVTHWAKETKETAKKAKNQKALHRSTHPPAQWAYPNDQDCNRYARPEESPLERVANDPNESNRRQGQGRDDGYEAESRYINYPFGKPEEETQAPPPREVPQDLRLSKEDLPSQDSLGQEAGIFQDPCPPDLQTGKQGMESDRFATILRNEIQQRKNRLQKSRSSTGLTGSAQAAEDAETTPASRETSTSSSDGSFSNAYKDNLKEVQTRVLHATSFRRRDLEPDTTTPPPPGAVVSRIGSRKRIPPEKKLRSFSEPNKLHEVGVVEPEPPVSLADRRKVFELTGKPVFQKPLPRQGAMQGSPEMPSRGRKKGGVGGGTNTSRGLPEGQQASVRQLQQRLESFGQYETSWNVPRKPPEARPAGRSHSAENILDPALEELSQSSWIHERSRSSPSADLYGQNIPVSGKNYGELTCPDPRIGELKHRESGERRSPAPLDHLPEPSAGAAVRHHPENRGTAPHLDQGYPHHRHDKPIPPNPQAPPPYPSSQSRRGSAPVEAGLGGQTAQSQLRAERCWRSEGVPSSSPLCDPELEDSWRAARGPEKSQRDPPSLPPPADSSSSPMDGLYPPAPRLGAQRPANQPPTSAHHDAPCSGWNESSSREVWKVPVPALARSAHQAERGPGYDHTHSGAPPPQATNGISPEEELRRAELARDIARSDRSLAGVVDSSGMRSTMDLTEGIYPQGGAVLEGRKPGPQQAPRGPPSSQERHIGDSMATAGSLANSSSFSTSAPVAEPLMKMKDVAGSDSKEELDMDLALKKHQLIDSLTQKLQALREMREGLLQEVRSNDTLGEEVECSVEQVCRPNELGKFRMFVGDLDKVVSLQLSLSGRLARVQNSIDKLPQDCQLQEKRTLLEKRDQLLRQQEDAKELKENLDRRERLVSDILTSQLSEKHLADFHHFVKTKAALIVERRKLDDKIKLVEEQLKSLTDSLLPDQRPPL